MKQNGFIISLIASMLLLGSCSTIKVVSDYDPSVQFNNYETYAFYKTGIDKALISDLDKKRILRAIEAEMNAKGYRKSQDPDIIISIFTNERLEVSVYNGGWGYGWGWPGYYGYWGFYGPYGWPGYYGNTVSTRTEGSLYIDVIDNNNRMLIWQGKGVADLYNGKKIEKKVQRIREIVAKIMSQYPPDMVNGG